jgi:hypothetical protein
MHKLTGSLFDKNRDYWPFFTAPWSGHFPDTQLHCSNVINAEFVAYSSVSEGDGIPTSSSYVRA